MAELTLKDLQIGGRNLIPDTSFTRNILVSEDENGFNSIKIYDTNFGWLYPYEGRKYLLSYGVAGDNYYYLAPRILVAVNEVYTLSFYYCTAGAVTGNSSFLQYNTGEHVPINFSDKANGWTKATFTFTTPDQVESVRLRFGINLADDGWLAISDIKLEKGNIATDWSPAMEDMAAKMDIPTSLPASDVSAWAKQASKPSYSASEISGMPKVTTGTTPPASGMNKGDIFIKL